MYQVARANTGWTYSTCMITASGPALALLTFIRKKTAGRVNRPILNSIPRHFVKLNRQYSLQSNFRSRLFFYGRKKSSASRAKVLKPLDTKHVPDEPFNTGSSLVLFVARLGIVIAAGFFGAPNKPIQGRGLRVVGVLTRVSIPLLSTLFIFVEVESSIRLLFFSLFSLFSHFSLFSLYSFVFSLQSSSSPYLSTSCGCPH